MYYMVITLKTSNLKILKLIVDKLIKPKKKPVLPVWAI